ncbi:MAG TPA: pyridoxamine 5'-phosphate oxidase family protein [Candidatus Saccharimonadales bacterium]|nr:pyridoxamine 5'-phosphate oxidase family protein [Candidatus Saccharimonadales bacterium]
MEAFNSIRTYIDQNPIATLGTINSDGSPHGAVIYVCTDSHRSVIYFITKQATIKYKNIIKHSQVSLTIVNPSENSTLQAAGRAFEIQEASTIDVVMKKIAHEHTSAQEWLPPIAKLRAGAYVIVGVELTNARLAQFKGMVIGDEHIFTKL